MPEEKMFQTSINESNFLSICCALVFHCIELEKSKNKTKNFFIFKCDFYKLKGLPNICIHFLLSPYLSEFHFEKQ